MWFPFALLSAFFYAALWVLARMSRGMPSTVVTALQFVFGPPLLFYTATRIEYPWHEPWWQLYLLLPLLILPLTAWAMTSALHTTEVTLVKPLFGLSSIATLFVSSSFFGETFSRWGLLGILLITLGLLLLYHERWEAWKSVGPWMVLTGAVIFGVNAAVVAEVVSRFPHVIALSALVMTTTFAANALGAGTLWRKMRWSRRNLLILLALAVACFGQDVITLYALTLGPSAYVIAVKRTSVLIVALLGYFFLHEREQSLWKLLLASALVVLGVSILLLC